MKTLFELGAEYENAAEVVKQRIAVKRKQLSAMKDCNSNDIYILKGEINSLYREYRDARDIAEHLKNYYLPESHGRKGELFI